MEKYYEIYYDERGLSKGEWPLDDHQIAHHVSCLPTDLRLKLESKPVEFCLEENGGRLKIKLQTQEPSLDLDETISDAVSKINSRVSGLSFLIDRISSIQTAA